MQVHVYLASDHIRSSSSLYGLHLSTFRMKLWPTEVHMSQLFDIMRSELCRVIWHYNGLRPELRALVVGVHLMLILQSWCHHRFSLLVCSPVLH